ncbi:MAG: hypothetical protein HC866_24095 [Leptolyngbyaceae cyanobacterium RU_5_1]|nr:hypothetical protein [Leptolyngbyaceae cyanobacterium RU_5_1]
MGATSAHALPGQTIETVRKWAENSAILPVLVYNRDVDAYTGLRSVPGGNLALLVKVRPEDNTSVEEQLVTIMNTPGLAFARNNAQGLEMIERMYNSQVTDDFRGSKYVGQIGNYDFYQGGKFVYIVSDGLPDGIRRFHVISGDQLDEAIAQAKHCQTHKCFTYQPFLTPGAEKNK